MKPWWNPNCDPNIIAVAVYGPIPIRPYKWWEKLLRRIGLKRLVRVPKRTLDAEEAISVAKAMALWDLSGNGNNLVEGVG